MTSHKNKLNPFPGLRAFEENEDIFFFGREKQVDELLTKLRKVRFLAILGASGSGKSSLVKSGLIPALHGGSMSATSSTWHICLFRPGGNPIWNLAVALSEIDEQNKHLNNEEVATKPYIFESILRRSSAGLTEVYRQSKNGHRHNLLILIDQFEEIFRFINYEKTSNDGRRDAVAFINLLISAAGQTQYPIYIVFTMRSDFLGDCTEFRGLPEIINKGQFLVPRMTREEIKEVITGPIAVGGAQITQQLLNQLLNDLGDNQDQLPILQHALMRTWDNWSKTDRIKNRPIDLIHYQNVGGMLHALSQHAEEAYAELPDAESQKICELVFKSLTEKGMEGRGVRRPSTVIELSRLTEAKVSKVIMVVNIFRQASRAFLMPPKNVVLNKNSIIDISHESLMRIWTRLVNWVDEEEISAQIYQKLCEATEQYESGNGGVMRNPDLQVALKWKETSAPNLAWASRYNSYFDKAIAFLNYSDRLNQLEEKEKEEKHRSRLRENRRVSLGLGFLAGLAIIAFLWALKQQGVAKKQKSVAIAKTNEALRQKSVVVKQKRLVEAQKANAIKIAVFARFQEQQATKARLTAVKSEKSAYESSEFAKRSMKKAILSAFLARQAQQLAEKEEIKAKLSDERAQLEMRNSTRLKNIADAKVAANESVLLLNENKYQASKYAALKSYQLNYNNGGPFQNNDIYTALNDNWHINHRWYLTANWPIRSIVMIPHSDRFMFVDEAGLVSLCAVGSGIITPLVSKRLIDSGRLLAVSPSGQRAVVFNARGSAKVLKLNSGSFENASSFEVVGNLKALNFIDDNNVIFLNNRGLYKINLSSAGSKAEFIATKDFTMIYTNAHRQILVGSKGTICVYASWENLFKGLKPLSTVVIDDNITAIAQDTSCTYTAAGTANHKVCLIFPDGEQVQFGIHASIVNSVAFAEVKSGHLQLASAGADQVIHLIDISPSKKIMEQTMVTLKGHNDWIYGLCYSTDGNFLYSVGEDKKLMMSRTTMEGLFLDLNK